MNVIPLAQQCKDSIRNVPDFPIKGIMFRDITTLLANGTLMATVFKAMAQPSANKGITAVVGTESRGFIFGTAIAVELGCGFVPVRKPNKLPAKTISQNYELEYGTDTLEIHADALTSTDRVLVVDDLLATGGTMAATCQLVEKLHAEIIGISCLVELDFLNGRKRLEKYCVQSLVHYDSE